MSDSVPQKTKQSVSGARAGSFPKGVKDTLRARHSDYQDHAQEDIDPLVMDIDLGMDVGDEGLLRAASEGIVTGTQATMSQVMYSIFGDPKEVKASVVDAVTQSVTNHRPLHLDDLPSRVIEVPELPMLPVGLVPWEPVLIRWAKLADAAKRGFPFSDPWLPQHPDVMLTGPLLPVDYAPWFLSVGTDPGPDKTDKGHTCLLLVGIPKGWECGVRETLYGPYGERFIVRLDALVMRLPQPWWDVYAYGAMKEASLYFVPPYRIRPA